MGAVLVAALLAQELPDLLDGQPAEPPPTPVKPKPAEDEPLVIPPPDGPVPPGVPTPTETPPPPPARRTPDETRELLIAERLRLQHEMPTYAIPTVVTSAGGLGFVLGAVITVMGVPAVLGRGSRDVAPFYFGLPLGLVGLGALVFGLMWERERSLDREPFLDRIDEIEKELGW